MVEESKKPVPPETPPRLPQFSLLSVFVVTIAVAVVCSLMFPMASVAALPLLVFFSVTLSAMLITVIIYGRSYQRTFCIGALVPLGVLLLKWPDIDRFLFGSVRRAFDPSDRLVIVGFWTSGILVGVICVGVRWLIGKPHGVRRHTKDHPDGG